MIFITHCPFIWTLILFLTKNIDASLENNNTILTKHNKLFEVLGIFLNCVIEQNHNVILIRDWANAFNYLSQRGPYFTVFNFDKFNERVTFYNRENYNKFHSINNSTIRKKKHPARYVALSVSNNSQLMLTLEGFRLSIWWDQNAVFLLVDKNVQNECNQAKNFLNTIWDFNILSAVYVCINSDNKLSAYTFNPFAPIATTLWKKVESFMIGTNEWTLFHFAIDGYVQATNSALCDNWFFDKIKHLNNHNIKSAFTGIGTMNIYDSSKIGLSRFIGPSFDIWCSMVLFMNATSTIKVYSEMKYIDKHGNGQGIFKDLQDGTVDLFVPMMFIRDYWYMQSYPYQISNGFCLSTIKDPILLEDQFSSFINSTIFFLFLIMMLVPVMLVKCFLKISVFESVFECTRMLIGTATTVKPKTTFARFFLLMNLLTFWIINCNLNSSLRAFFTVSKYHPTIETLEDLVKSNLKIYGLVHHKQFLLYKELADRYEGIADTNECFNRLLKAERICCFSPYTHTQGSIEETNSIHISHLKSASLPVARTFRKDWPLRLKYNRIISKLYEAGILELIEKRRIESLLRNRNVSIINVDKRKNKKLVTGLWFTLIWGFTLSCSMFIVENLYSRIAECDYKKYFIFKK